MSKDPNYSVKVEKAIAEKYGDKTIQHPKKNWNDDKEEKYVSQLKQFYSTYTQIEDDIEVDGVLISKKLITRESKRSCPVCNIYSFKSNDDVYMSKFDCCFNCYIQWVEGREKRWLKGWRPNNANNKKKT